MHDKRKPVIAVRDLPERANSLSPQELSRVFGGSGCRTQGQSCSYLTPCCSPMQCSLEYVPQDRRREYICT